MTYGYSMRFNGGGTMVTGCPTQREAIEKCLSWAIVSGWTPPMWWQFWRWDDTSFADVQSALMSAYKDEKLFRTECAS